LFPLHIPDTSRFTRRRRVRGPDGTRALGAELAGVLAPGDAVLCHGALGAGKTCLIQGLCAALDVAEDVLSPTFTLVNRYHGRLIVDHLDFYRVEPGHDLGDIGVHEMLDELEAGRTVLLAEWPQLLLPLLPRRIELLAVAGDEPDLRTWYARGLPDLPRPCAALFPEAVAPC
jgi:tRNA threonylcarbamoyladenosine biosynthesis protein TsaE